MRKIRPLFKLLWVIIFILSSCTIDVSQSTPPAASVNPTQCYGNRGTSFWSHAGTISFSIHGCFYHNSSTTKIPVTWEPLNLEGKLVFISAVQRKAPIRSRACKNSIWFQASLTTLYQGPPQTWIYSLAISPDGKQLVMGYSTPVANGDQPIQALYQMPLDGSAQPQMVIPTQYPEDEYLQPEWSPDGKYLYFSHVDYKGVSNTQPYPDL